MPVFGGQRRVVVVLVRVRGDKIGGFIARGRVPNRSATGRRTAMPLLRHTLHSQSKAAMQGLWVSRLLSKFQRV